MEPGHEDREYDLPEKNLFWFINEPQWSPVMKTGNTSSNTVAMT